MNGAGNDASASVPPSRAGHALQVRAAQPADRDALLALRCALWPQHEPLHHEREIRRRAQAAARHATLLVTDDAGRACGFVELTRKASDAGAPGRVLLDGVFVAPPARRRGAARRLLAAAEHWAHGRGAALLVCELDAADTASREALAWLGFGDPEQRVRVVRRVSAPLQVSRPAAVPGPAAGLAPAARSARSGAHPVAMLVHLLLFAAALASFAYTDIYARDMLHGVLLPLLDVLFVLYFMGVVLTWRYRRRADSSRRAERLFRDDG